MNQLTSAIKQLEARVGKIISRSEVYDTAARDLPDAPDFLNQVIQIQTTFNPYALLYQTISIEIAMGRQFEANDQSRCIDIDILYYNDQVIRTPFLTLPHPRITERRFVLEPLTEIAPDLKHPLALLTHKELLSQCDDYLKVEKLVIE